MLSTFLILKIAGVNYGGHVTDDWDRRLLMTYVSDAFCDGVLTVPFYKFSSNVYFYIPKDGPINTYREFISMLPNVDKPDTFGQNPNADIASQIRETRYVYFEVKFLHEFFLILCYASLFMLSLSKIACEKVSQCSLSKQCIVVYNLETFLVSSWFVYAKKYCMLMTFLTYKRPH